MGPRNRGESIHTYVLLVYILFVFGTYSCNYSFQPIPTSLCFWVFRNPTPKPGPILSSRQIHTCCSPLPNFRRARCETSIASLPLRQLAVIQKQSDQQNPVFATATWKKKPSAMPHAILKQACSGSILCQRARISPMISSSAKHIRSRLPHAVLTKVTVNPVPKSTDSPWAARNESLSTGAQYSQRPFSSAHDWSILYSFLDIFTCSLRWFLDFQDGVDSFYMTYFHKFPGHILVQTILCYSASWMRNLPHIATGNPLRQDWRAHKPTFHVCKPGMSWL